MLNGILETVFTDQQPLLFARVTDTAHYPQKIQAHDGFVRLEFLQDTVKEVRVCQILGDCRTETEKLLQWLKQVLERVGFGSGKAFDDAKGKRSFQQVLLDFRCLLLKPAQQISETESGS